MSVLISGPPDAIWGSKVDVVRLRKCGCTVLKAIGEKHSELSIALVDDSQIKDLNAQWRGKPQATDVLSFSQIEGDFAEFQTRRVNQQPRLLGDVVISVETAAAQARDRHRSLDDVVAKLLIHGVLHLIGHDHVEDVDAKRMQSEERRVWRGLQPS